MKKKTAAASDCIIGIDAGSSFIKAVAFDLAGHELHVAETPSLLEKPHPLWVEQDMRKMWSQVRRCVTAVAQTMRQRRKRIIGLGLTSTGDGTFLMDAKGHPVRHGLLWCDGRAGKIVERWTASKITEQAFPICGTSVFTGSQAVQLAWLRENEPAALKKAAVIFHAKDWLFYKFTGKITTDDTDESLTMLRMSTRQYDPELFRIFQIEDLFSKFPPVLPSEKNVGALLPTVARELSLDAGLPVGSGPMDVSACALGSGAIEHADASSILGTAGIHQLVMNRPLLAPKNVGMTICHGVRQRWIRLIAAMIATPNLDWFLKELGGGAGGDTVPGTREYYAQLEKVVKGIPPGADGVMYHPYLFPGGERGPFVKPTARGSFTGLTANHRQAHLLRAVYEGVALSMLDCYRHMPLQPARIYLSGGGATSPLWCQIVADCLGKPVLVPAGSQFGAKGAAINLGLALGVYRNARAAVRKTVRMSRRYTPNRGHTRYYAKLYSVYRATYESQMAIWDLRNQLLNLPPR